jgi:1-deoxy-D-xylulose-5-phosphate synthase
MFENMGLTYLGPVDGHDVNELIRVIRVAKEMQQPVLLHVFTQKGCGYQPAEDKPAKFHGVGKFDPESGETLGEKKYTFSDAFGETMLDLAAEDKRVCGITAAMPGGTGLLNFKEKYPDRLFDVGIAEEHAVSMAGGLAKQGMVPVLALYSTFLQRAYDQIMQDIAMQNLHVVLAVDRAGLVGEDGETHHGVFDVGVLRQVPGMKILCPASCEELKKMLRWAVQECDGPVAIRYPRGGDGDFRDSKWEKGAAVVSHRQGKDGAIVTYGNLVNNALTAADILAEQGIHVSVIRLTQLAPLDFGALKSALFGIEHVVIAEEANSGIHEAIAWELGKEHQFSCIDLRGEFVTHGSIAKLHEQYGLDAASIAGKIKEVLGNEN